MIVFILYFLPLILCASIGVILREKEPIVIGLIPILNWIGFFHFCFSSGCEHEEERKRLFSKLGIFDPEVTKIRKRHKHQMKQEVGAYQLQARRIKLLAELNISEDDWDEKFGRQIEYKA